MLQLEAVLPAGETQNARLLRALIRGERITPLDSWIQLGIYRLASRIHDLRTGKFDGHRYPIENEWYHAHSKWGDKVVVARYFIEPDVRGICKYLMEHPAVEKYDGEQ